MTWARDDTALALLETEAGPFSVGAFRSAVVETMPGWRDASFGGRSSDGTRVAVPLLARGKAAESVPPAGYGAVVATRPLDAFEISQFLAAARKAADVASVRVRALETGSNGVRGHVFASASVVRTGGSGHPSERYARLARRSLRKAARAGAMVVRGAGADDLLPLYRTASASWAMRYPEPLVRRLVETGCARVDAVRHGDRVVAALLTLTSGGHWMCWLAAQAPEGREIAASYLAYDAVFTDAHAAGMPFVNLGASAAGGAEFKHHLGATEAPMFEWRSSTALGAASSAVLVVTSRSLRRVRSLLRRHR